jgi:hypothetical protein
VRLTFLLVIAGACALAVGASIVMTRASNRSALWNMALGGALALAVLAAALLIAYFMTRAVYPG